MSTFLLTGTNLFTLKKIKIGNLDNLTDSLIFCKLFVKFLNRETQAAKCLAVFSTSIVIDTCIEKGAEKASQA